MKRAALASIVLDMHKSLCIQEVDNIYSVFSDSCN